MKPLLSLIFSLSTSLVIALNPTSCFADSDKKSAAPAKNIIDVLYSAGQFNEAITALNEAAAKSELSLERQRQLAICYCQLGQYEKAEPIFKNIQAQTAECSSALMDVAAILFHGENYAESLKLCQKAEQMGPSGHYTKALIQLAKAENLYRLNKIKEAEESYHSALNGLGKNDSALAARLALCGIAGCYWYEKNYEKAAEFYKELALINRNLYGEYDLDYGWSLLHLADAYKQLNNPEGQVLSEKCVWIFRKANRDRILAQYAKEVAADKTGLVRKRIDKYVFGQGNKQEYAHADKNLSGRSKHLERTNGQAVIEPCAWGHKFKVSETPGIVWLNPLLPQKAIVLCVHGLGLHNRSYESFATRVAEEGITTIAFDVRGFGSYLQSKGMERLDMKSCVDDLHCVARVIRRDNPDVPLFLLGESMGGAITLRLAAEAPELIDGLICSVPAGSRYRSTGTALYVGLHYLKNKNRLFNIGERIVEQATSEHELQEKWKNDPANRLKLSAKELIEFQHFMDQNPVYAKRICHTPVIVFQGDEDKLVKEQSTFDLFQSVASPEKILVLLGQSEHLIFEAGQFKDDVTLGVIGWMQARCSQKKVQKAI